MKTIYKYKLNGAPQDVKMPGGAQILTAGYQGDDICIWALVDPCRSMENRRLFIAGTGHEIGDAAIVHISTFQNGPFVWHVFEQLP